MYQQGQVFGMTGRSRAPTQIQVAVETETYIQVCSHLLSRLGVVLPP
jgi:hypothetical protein